MKLLLIARSLCCLAVALPTASLLAAATKPAPPVSTDSPQMAYYAPHMLPTAQDAAQKLQLMAPRLVLGSKTAPAKQITGATRMTVDPNSLQLLFPAPVQPEKKRSMLSFGKKAAAAAQQGAEAGGATAPQAPQAPEGANALAMPTGDFKMPSAGAKANTSAFVLLFKQVSSMRTANNEVNLAMADNSTQVISTADPNDTPMLMDALLTLIVAGGNQNVVLIDMDTAAAPPATLQPLSLPDAALVTMVHTAGPAADAGLQKGDLITAIDGVPYHNNLYSEAANKCFKAHPEGCSVKIKYLRAGAANEVAVKVNPAMPPTPEQLAKLKEALLPPPPPLKLGIRVRDLTEEDARVALMPDNHGVVVESMDVGSLAEQMKMHGGDIIVAIDANKIASSDDLRKVLQSGKGLAITIWRDGAPLKLVIPASF